MRRSETVTRNPGSSSIKRMRKFVLPFRRHGRKPHRERCPRRGVAAYANGTAMRFHNSFHEIEPQSGAVYLIRYGAAAPDKRIEDLLLLVRRNPRPPVHYRDLDRAAV